MKTRIVLICTAAIMALLAWREFRPVYSSPIRDDTGAVLPGSISRLQAVTIGGMKQWIQIRGNDATNPVLLWLHGGPGSAQMPIAEHYDKDLEKEFVVVHWDQRGAGKSNPPGFDVQTMTLEQYIQDAHELTSYLKRELHKQKIYLVGHSWGTVIGISLSHRYPEDYYAYVGVSQVVDDLKAQEIACDWVRGVISKSSIRELETLSRLGKSPYTDHEKYVDFAHFIDAHGGGMDVGMAQLAKAALQSREYRLSDFVRWLNGANRGSGPMWDSCIRWKVYSEAPQISIPVFFFSGKNDYNTPLQLVEEYQQALDAPKGKTIVVFDESAHAPFLKQPDLFYHELVTIKEKTYLGK